MTTTHNLHCDCGFSTIVSAGGLRNSFLQECYFPHYCKTCGIVDVNTALHEINCPKCLSSDINAYGTNELQKKTDNHIIPSIQSFNHSAYKYGNFCPSCKEFTLVIEYPEIYFD